MNIAERIFSMAYEARSEAMEEFRLGIHPNAELSGAKAIGILQVLAVVISEGWVVLSEEAKEDFRQKVDGMLKELQKVMI